jgi:hypothetical protein
VLFLILTRLLVLPRLAPASYELHFLNLLVRGEDSEYLRPLVRERVREMLGGLGETHELLLKGDTGISLINHRLT